MLPELEVTLDTLLEVAILLAILVEIGFGWLQHGDARRWHQEEMAMWHLENGDSPEGERK